MKIDFQIVHSVNHDIKEYLLDILKQTIDDSTTIEYNVEEKTDNLEDWSIFNWIEIKYNYKIEENKNIVGFSLEIEEKLVEIIREFGDTLNDDENIEVVFKYFDEAMFEKQKNIAEEIFDIEMKLREILTFIFIDTYKKEYYDLLKEIDVKIQPSNKSDKNKNYPDEKDFKSHFENEFFFLLFSDYMKLDHLKPISKNELIDMIENSFNFNELKWKLQVRGIINETYKELIFSIKQNMNPIENIRNCIAHNRFFTDSTLENYIKAKEKLNDIMNKFWENIRRFNKP